MRDLGLISRGEANRRLSQTLGTLGRLDRHGPSGMFFNWYDERTGAVLHTWPSDGGPVYPFLSSVDNGWLAAALIVVSNAGDVRVARLAEQLLKPMNFKPTTIPALRGSRLAVCCAAGSGQRSRRRHQTPLRATILALVRTSSTPASGTTRLSRRPVSPPTSASPVASCRPSTTSRSGGPSRRAATGRGRSSSRSAPPVPTSALTCSRARTPTGACESCRAGVAPCSRR